MGEGTGEVESEDGVLILRRVHVKFTLRAPDEHRETANRVLGIFADRCPIYRTLKPAIAMTMELTVIPPEAS